MKFAKSYFCSANVIWLREILVIVRQVKLGSPTEIGFANLLFRQIVRQVALTRKFMNPCNEECDLVDDELKSIASSFSNLTSSINGDSQMLIML